MKIFYKQTFYQGSKGIRRWSINWFTFPIHIIIPSVDLDTQLNEQTNQNSIKVPKVVKPTKKKTLI